MIPEMLTNCVMFIDGVSFSGDVPSMTLPKLSTKTEEYRGGGMSGPVDLPTGLEKLEAAFTTNGVRKEALKFFGLADQTACNAVFRSSFKGQRGTVKAVTATLRGSLKEVDLGDWKPGDKSEIKHGMRVIFSSPMPTACWADRRVRRSCEAQRYAVERRNESKAAVSRLK